MPFWRLAGLSLPRFLAPTEKMAFLSGYTSPCHVRLPCSQCCLLFGGPAGQGIVQTAMTHFFFFSCEWIHSSWLFCTTVKFSYLDWRTEGNPVRGGVEPGSSVVGVMFLLWLNAEVWKWQGSACRELRFLVQEQTNFGFCFSKTIGLLEARQHKFKEACYSLRWEGFSCESSSETGQLKAHVRLHHNAYRETSETAAPTT